MIGERQNFIEDFKTEIEDESVIDSETMSSPRPNFNFYQSINAIIQKREDFAQRKGRAPALFQEFTKINSTGSDPVPVIEKTNSEAGQQENSPEPSMIELLCPYA